MKRKLFSFLALSMAFLPVLADSSPSFPGGEEALNKYIASHTKYPSAAKENGVEGVVTVGFLVAVNGELLEIKSLNFVDPDLEAEAVRVVGGMPAWIPAEKDGTPIEAPSKVEIPFILEE